MTDATPEDHEQTAATEAVTTGQTEAGRFDPPRDPDRSGLLTGRRDHGIWYGVWYPDPAPLPDRGVVVVAHGFGEYTGRYGQIIRALNRHGYAVVAADHRGHGRSEGTRFRIARFDDFVEDLDQVVGIAREVAERRGTGDREPFLFGHSMGGLIATRYVLSLADQAELSGLILSAPALQMAPDLPPAALRLTGVLARLLPALPIRRDSGGLSSDPEIARLWALDPLLNHGPPTIQMAHQIATNARDTRGQLANITLPTLLFFGEADTVVDPAGARVFAERAASPDLTVWPLPGLMHETFNEPGGAEIVDRMVDWLDARTSRDPGLTV